METDYINININPMTDVNAKQQAQIHHSQEKIDIPVEEKDRFIPSDNLKSEIAHDKEIIETKEAVMSAIESLSNKRQSIRNQMEFYFRGILK